MKRFVGFLFVFACLMLVLQSNFSVAVGDDDDDDDDDDKVTICHVHQNFERPNGIVFFVGIIIEVDEHAAEHHEDHGDVLLSDFPDGTFTGACCSFSVLPNGDIVPGQVD